MIEEQKELKDYPNYFVSNLGRVNGTFIKEWIFSREIERILGFPHSSINACCKGKIKSHGKEINIKQAYGYVWKYK